MSKIDCRSCLMLIERFNVQRTAETIAGRTVTHGQSGFGGTLCGRTDGPGATYTLSLRLTLAQYEKARQLAALRGVSLTDAIRRAIEAADLTSPPHAV